MKIKCVYIAVLFACSLFLTGCRFHKDFGETTSPENTMDEVHTEIISVLDKGSWSDDVTQCASDFTFELSGRKIYYHSVCGTFNDVTNRQHMSLSEEERARVNQLLGVETVK